MATLIIILFVLSIYHFAYEAVFARNERYCMRYKLYALRDKLINLKIDKDKEVSNEVFDTLLFSINGLIQSMNLYTLVLVSRAKYLYDTNPEVKKEANKKLSVVNSCDLKEIKEISTQRDKYFMDIVVINAGGWLIYIIPILLIAIIYLFCKTILNRRIQRAVYVSEDKISKMPNPFDQNLAY